MLASRTVRGWVGSTDPSDFYRFTVVEPTAVSLTLEGSATFLLSNAGGTLDGRTARSEDQDGLLHQTLLPGEYTVRIDRGTNIERAEYALSIAFGEGVSSATSAVDGAGSTLATARTLLPGQAVSDWVDPLDKPGDHQDMYRFSVTGMTRVELTLSGLSAPSPAVANAGFALLDAAGTSLRSASATSLRPGSMISYLDTGEYFVRVEGPGGWFSGAYTLALAAAPIEDGAGNTVAAARKVTSLTAAPLVFKDWVGTADRDDFYSFTLAEDAVVSIALDTDIHGSATEPLSVRLVNASGENVLPNSQIGWTMATQAESLRAPLDAGTYYAKVTGGTAPTAYALSMSAAPCPDTAGSTAAAARNLGALVPSEAAERVLRDHVGRLDPTDVYAFTLNAVTDVSIRVGPGPSDPVGHSPALALRNGDGTLIASDMAYGLATDAAIRRTLGPGSYLISVEEEDPNVFYAYTLALGTLPPAFGSATLDGAGSGIGLARVIDPAAAGTQSFADWVGAADPADWYRFTLTADSLVNLRAAAGGDATLTLTDASGKLMRSSGGTAASDASLVDFLSAGTYGIHLANSTLAGAGYSLLFSATAVADGAGDSAGAARALGTLGATPIVLSDHIGRADTQDWYSFTVAERTLLRVEATAPQGIAFVNLVTERSGTPLRLDPGSGRDEHAHVTVLPQEGTYRILVEAGADFTPYTLRLSSVVLADTGGDTAATAQSITPVPLRSGTPAHEALTGSGLAEEIRGLAGADTLSGLGGNDTLLGGDGADHLSGGAGSDALDGGAEADTAGWAGARSQFQIRSFEQNGRVLTEVRDLSGAEGTDLVTGVETLAFAGGAHRFGLAWTQQNRTSNMDGGAFDDVLFQNTATGAVGWRDMGPNGATGGFGTLLGALPAGWRLFDTADLTGDGRAELLVQDGATGSTYHVSFAGAAPAWGVVTTSAAPTLRAVAAGDITRDGTADVLFRQDDGFLYAADMGPGGFERWVLVGNLGQAWRTVGLGDMNADGASDVVFQEIATGLTYYRDVVQGSWGYVAGGLGTTWVARGAGDMNGDGFDDMLFGNVHTGDLWYTNMAGGSGLGAAWGVVADRLAGWHMRGTADVDNDGWDDVLVQNQADGTTYWRNMDQGVATGWGVVTGGLGTGWIAS